jgi:hypothetical protein
VLALILFLPQFFANECNSILLNIYGYSVNPTFNNISVTDILWRSVLLVEETGENHDLSQVADKLDHIMSSLKDVIFFQNNFITVMKL